ncbi:type II toxin-antitoxin system TacA family antitoxin [Klebsiella pneumoniae]|nr:DUF1778 domain-containing protein [Klebsiella pneumoniae]MDP0858239.1 DUF1778 domain-containing protein [Klebsiella pneumoniae]
MAAVTTSRRPSPLQRRVLIVLAALDAKLRAKESQRALIDAAAEILHKSRTDFILEMACKAAENVILDRRVFNFNDEQYAEFIDMLDAPVEDEPAINKLLARKPQWDV